MNRTARYLLPLCDSNSKLVRQIFRFGEQEYSRNACLKTLDCGHPCGGVREESECLPCLFRCSGAVACLKQDADDMCMICFTEALSAAPAIQVTLIPTS